MSTSIRAASGRCTLASSIVDDWISCPERWALLENEWTNEGIRAFTLAYLLNCPEDELDTALETVREKVSEHIREAEAHAALVALGMDGLDAEKLIEDLACKREVAA